MAFSLGTKIGRLTYVSCYLQNLINFILSKCEYLFGKLFIKTGGERSRTKLSDNELVEKYKTTRENMYLGELFERYTHFMFCVCLKYLKDEEKSKDAVMQIVEKLMTDLLKHDVSNFKSWLHVVVKNHCLMQIRSEKSFDKKRSPLEKDMIIFMETGAPMHPDIESDVEIKLDLLEKGIHELDDEQKKCIDLFYLQDKSYADIMEITGYTMNQVKSYIQNGKRNLKIYITDMYGKQA
ncbi:MAG: sigma-70 family RNA polymerase sigma factor [Bacteroidia bacterium]|nr:sigma-70 family RNA polymerase sigma factor [Bacteroidia bacterium]